MISKHFIFYLASHGIKYYTQTKIRHATLALLNIWMKVTIFFKWINSFIEKLRFEVSTRHGFDIKIESHVGGTVVSQKLSAQ